VTDGIIALRRKPRVKTDSRKAAHITAIQNCDAFDRATWRDTVAPATQRHEASVMIRSIWLTVLVTCAAVTVASAQDQSNPLPKRADIPGITPEILVRTTVPGVPWKQEIVTRTTYQPGARIRKHYHPSQIVFLILEGTMGVQEDGKGAVTLKAGDTLLIPPGTIHSHWNASQTDKLVFAEFVLVDDGQRSAVFVE
jgi:quercetin dioxygenase-like cupin family protein